MLLTRNFAINNIYLYDRKAYIKKKIPFQQNSSWLYGHSVYCRELNNFFHVKTRKKQEHFVDSSSKDSLWADHV